MSELINLQQMSPEEIMKAIGQDSGSENTNIVPRLTINRNPEDDNGNQLPIGSFTLSHSAACIFPFLTRGARDFFASTWARPGKPPIARNLPGWISAPITGKAFILTSSFTWIFPPARAGLK